MRNDYDAPENEPDFSEEYNGDGLRFVSLAIVFIVVAGFFALAWYAYDTSTYNKISEGKELKLIKAENTPFKEAPKDPGGMEIPYQNKEIYETITAETPKPSDKKDVKIIRQEEKPLIAEQHAKSGNKIESWIKKSDKKEETSATNASEKKEPVEVIEIIEAKNKALQIYEKDSEPIKGDNDKGDSTAATTEDVIVATAEKYTPSPSKDKKEQVVASENSNRTEEKVEIIIKRNTGKDDAQKNKEKAANAIKKNTVKPKKASSNKGKYKIQLAALRSHRDAQNTWRIIYKKYKNIIGNRPHSIMKVDIKDKGTFYRLRVGGFSSKEEAKKICDELKKRGQACIAL